MRLPFRPQLLALAALLVPLAARANGAFPDSMRVLLPQQDPQHVFVATNFGMVISLDAGAHWRYVCEGRISSALGVTIYDQGPSGTLYAASPAGLARSSDDGCTWKLATGSIANRRVWDVFPDPTNASVVWAIGGTSGAQSALYKSTDGGATFGAPLYTSQDLLNGIESARSDPKVVWASGFHAGDSAGPTTAYLLRSTDGGASWNRLDSERLVNTLTRLASVDPVDAGKAYLRITPLGTRADQLGIASGGGAQIDLALTLDTAMGGFVRRSDGTLVVGGTNGKLWTRAPDASDFTQGAGPHVRCLGERGGALYACGDNFADHFALGEQADDGTFTPRLHFEDIQGPLECLQPSRACDADWSQLRARLGLPAEEPDAGEDPPDAQTTSDAGVSVDAGTDGGTSITGQDGGGCGCTSTQAGASFTFALLALLSRRRRSGATIAGERRLP